MTGLPATDHTRRAKRRALGIRNTGSPKKRKELYRDLLKVTRKTVNMAERMLQEGVYVIGFSFPVVPRGAARIRAQVSAALSFEDLDFAIGTFAKVGKELGAI